MDSTRSFLQSSATSDSCVNVKKQRGRMPPAAKGLSPFGNPLGKTMTPVGARLRAPAGVIIFQVGVRGLSPPAARGIFLPSLKDKVQLFLERIQIPRGPGAGFGVAGFEHVPDELGVFVKALRRSRMGSRKAFMDSTRSFLQSSATSDSCVNVKKQKEECLRRQRAEPLWKPLGKTMTPVGARLRANEASLFSRSGVGG